MVNGISVNKREMLQVRVVHTDGQSDEVRDCEKDGTGVVAGIGYKMVLEGNVGEIIIHPSVIARIEVTKIMK